MTALLLVSDTHVPRRAKDIPLALWSAVDEADIVIHAGDWVDIAFFDALEQRASRVIAVWGNNDGPELRARMPEVAHETIDGVRFAVTHETGPSSGREQRMDAAFPDTDVLVFGHSHIPWDSATPRGLRLLNPGSPTDRRRQPDFTWMTLDVVDGSLGDTRLHRLPGGS